ncbi:MAG: outer membrane beta-barrel protein [Bacteroidetes bacterium]|nr:outer membrane beta-barrel protein [Bacteroidota bacterium]
MQKKNLLLAAFILFFSVVANAQIEKGNWLLGGSFSYGTTNYQNSPSYSNAGISPHIGYAIGKNSVLGLNFLIGFSETAAQNKSFNLYTNAVYKKFFPIKEKFGMYLQLNAGLGLSRNSYYNFDSSGASVKTTYNSHTYLAGALPGFYYRVTPGILLNVDCGGLAYNYTEQDANNWSSGFTFNFLSNFTFGVDFILGRKKS